MASCIGAQLFTLREFIQTPEDVAKTMKRLREIGYEAVQVSAMGPIDKTELRKILDGEGITCAATHIGFHEMRDETERVVEEHKILGCDYPAIGGIPGEYKSGEGYAAFAREASEVGAKLAEHGLTFGYHNHSFELEKYGDRTGLQILVEDSDPCVTFEIDTYWIQHGGGSPAEWIRKVSGRIPLLHLKDMGVGPEGPWMTEVGEGNLDWPGILDAAKGAGTVWYLVEQDTCQRDPFDSMEISFKNLKAMGLE